MNGGSNGGDSGRCGGGFGSGGFGSFVLELVVDLFLILSDTEDLTLDSKRSVVTFVLEPEEVERSVGSGSSSSLIRVKLTHF